MTVVSGGALTGAEDTLAVTRAAPGAGRGQVTRHAGGHLKLLVLSPVIIEREEPVARVQIVARLPTQTRL